MSIRILRGDTDPVIEQIIQALKIYEDDHPNSEIALYRQNPVSVRIRIIDPNLARHNKIQLKRFRCTAEPVLANELSVREDRCESIAVRSRRLR
jgi:hypothetical protein